MGRSFGVKQILGWGLPGNGKTTYVMQLCKALTALGKAYYNSIEQGDSKSLQDVIALCRMDECAPGTIVFGDRDTFEDMMEKLRKNRAKFVVIDSRDYMELTQAQWKLMTETFPKKAFIIVCWEGFGGNPKSEHAAAIRFMADIKVHVRNGVATAQSRFGPTKPYRIFEKQVKPGEQIALPMEDQLLTN